MVRMMKRLAGKLMFWAFVLFVVAVGTSDLIAGVALRATVAVPMVWMGVIDQDLGLEFALWHLWSGGLQ